MMSKYKSLEYVDLEHTNSVKIVELDGKRIGTLVGTLAGWLFHADNGVALNAIRMTELSTQLLKLNNGKEI